MVTPLRDIASDSDNKLFPVVGLGASAGGLEALEHFLGNVAADSGMAYVVIQHLDPTQKGMLPELLQRISKIEVFQAEDQMSVKPNHIYVIPPNKSMSIINGRLRLTEPAESRGLRLPIDFFLRSLAKERGDQGVGVILSGMGSDGCEGIKALKEKNGIVMVQDPGTAKFDSMPRNAINAVVVDIVSPASDLPGNLSAFVNQMSTIGNSNLQEIKDQSSLEKVINLIRIKTGNDFLMYKSNTIYRRIERRMSIFKMDRISMYIKFLQENPKEIDILFKELLIGVTSFFRDAVVWEKLGETVLPEMIKNAEEGTVLRAWVPGCSTGEEAYSLAILFSEVHEKMGYRRCSLHIFASDLDNEAIVTARKGLFPRNIASDLTPHRLSRFFIPTEDGYRIRTEIREMVVFAHHNVIMHPPFTKIDFLSCRNLLIYMDVELQKKLLDMFYYSIRHEGFLLLGSSESLGKLSNFFIPIESRLKIYQRVSSIIKPNFFDFPSSFSRTNPIKTEIQMPDKSFHNIEKLADQLLLQHFSPPGVLVNENGDIIYISGRTGKYLEPPVGKANMNIYAMLREGLRAEFPAAFHKALQTRQPVILYNLKVGTNGSTQTLNIKIQWIDKPDLLKGNIMIVFNDVKEATNLQQKEHKGRKTAGSIRQSELEQELRNVREEIRNTLEEMQTTQEEHKSTNEELQSTNEELQSTNEELTTSKEEMQSLNEELQTVNAELQSKIDDFIRVDNDMKNLLNSTDIATLFLDKELNIRRYTDQATKIFKLIKSDIGRPFTDLVTDLNYPHLVEDALEVLRTLVFIEKQIPARGNRWFSIRIMPYRTFDDRIDGLVITFVNNSSSKQLELALHETSQMHQILLNLSSDVILRLAADWTILEFNPEAEKFFGEKRRDVVNRNFTQLFIPESNRSNFELEMNGLMGNTPDGEFKSEVITSGGEVREVVWSVCVLFNDLKVKTGMIFSKKTAKN